MHKQLVDKNGSMTRGRIYEQPLRPKLKAHEKSHEEQYRLTVQRRTLSVLECYPPSDLQSSGVDLFVRPFVVLPRPLRDVHASPKIYKILQRTTMTVRNIQLRMSGNETQVANIS